MRERIARPSRDDGVNVAPVAAETAARANVSGASRGSERLRPFDRPPSCVRDDESLQDHLRLARELAARKRRDDRRDRLGLHDLGGGHPRDGGAPLRVAKP